MPKVKYNAEASNRPQVPPGVYKARIEEINEHTSKAGNETLQVITKLMSGKAKGATIYTYIGLTEASQWRFDQLVDATGVTAKKGRDVDTDKLVGKLVMVKTGEEPFEGEMTPRINRFNPIDDEGEADDEDDADEEDDEDEDEGEDEDEDGDEEEDDYNDWSVDDLKAELEERELSTTGRKAALVKRLEDNDEEGDDEDEDEGDEEEAPDYTEWSITDLRAELDRRSLKRTGSKSAIIKRLETDDAADEPI